MQTILQNRYIRNLLDFIFPALCLGCSCYCDNNVSICSDCERIIEKINLPYCLHCLTYMDNDIKCHSCEKNSFALYSYANYTGPTREIIIQYKFKGITAPARIFAERLYGLYGELLKKYDADYLIPIPLYHTRENQRGYNQATILANEISLLSGIKVNDQILTRVKKRKPQAKLAISEREKNIRSVFAVDDNQDEVKTCILVDDVVTTGSTVFEASKVLEDAGYKVEAVISIAHAF